MKRPVFPKPLLEGLAAGIAGLALYGAAAGIEIALGSGPAAAALLEELGKAGLLLLSGWLGIRTRAEWTKRERNPARRARSQALALARGLSLGLVAIALFAGIENVAYLIAFPEAGVLGRLLWSLPVHLVAALLEALGAVFLFTHPATRIEAHRPLRSLTGPLVWTGALVLATAWHLSANLLASGRLTFPLFTTGVVIAHLLCLALLFRFLRQAYLGGFLHGAD